MLLKEVYFLCLDDIIVKIKELLSPERKMINEDIMVCKLILVDPQPVQLVKDRFRLSGD